MVDEQTIDAKLLQQAIQVLKLLTAKHYGDSSKKKKLFEDEKESALYLQFTLKKIPKCKSIKMIKINLPHSLIKDDSEICVITGDLDKTNKKAEIEPDQIYYKDLFKKHDINNISEVVTLRQLRTEYKPYEAKQKLLAAYDVFLADRKIAECLPRVLGRHFFKKRKFPIQITLNTPNLKQQVENALSTKVFYLTGHGNCCNSEVAYLSMSDQEISENVQTMAKTLCDKLPGSWDNVKGIYLKTALSKAIPLYMSYDDPNKIHLIDEPDKNTYEIDELSTCPNSLVKVYKDGSIRTVRMKRMADTEISESTDIRGDSEKNKEENVIDDSSNVATADLNEESSKPKKKRRIQKVEEIVLEEESGNLLQDLGKEESPKPKKKRKIQKVEEIVLEEESDNLLQDMKGKDDSIKLKRKSKAKKKNEERVLEKQKSICNIKEEMKNVEEKVKSKQIKRSILEDKTEKFIPCTDFEEKSSEIQSQNKSKKKRKSDGNTLKEIYNDATISEIKEKSSEIQSQNKSKKKRKSDGNMLKEIYNNATISEIKGKEKRRKSFVK